MDFDIDKAYVLGSGFNSSGQFESWSALGNYSTLEQLNALEKLPIPKGKEVSLTTTGVNLTTYFNEFLSDVANQPNSEEFTAKQINSLNSALRAVNQIKSNKVNVTVVGDEILVSQFLDLINRHNTSKEYLRKNHAMKNSIVARIKQIISAPSNQLLANSPVDIDDWHTAANNALAKKGTVPSLLSSYDMFSYYKQQRDAAVGKDDVGIAANGLKVFFSLSSYYDDYYGNSFERSAADLRKSFKTFKKEFKFVDVKDPKNTLTYSIGTIGDSNISENQTAALRGALNDTEGKLTVLRTDAALALSGFTSAATDNAKELLMAKINANVELASMHIYLLTLGLTANQVAEIMTSTVVDEIIENLEVNMFFTNKTPLVSVILGNLVTKYKNDPAMLQNVTTIRDIYNGAQEIKILAKMLSINQRTSANTGEVNNFLTTFESAIYSRENQIFGDSLKDFKFWKEYRNSPDLIVAKNATDKFEKLVDKVFEANKQLNPLIDRAFVTRVLTKASDIEINYVDSKGEVKRKSVSLLGGEFDFRNYIYDEDYKALSKEYYNLIKNTYNIFDVVDTVPHFKEMISGLVLSHNILLNSSVKYNVAFTLLKDVVRKHSPRIVFGSSEKNPNVKNQMGNEALFPLLTERHIQKCIIGTDIRLKGEWLKSSGTSSLVFNATELLRKLNENSGLEAKKNVMFYTSDNAWGEEPTAENSKLINSTDTVDFIISMDTNYGIANFKRLMEEILLPMLQTKSNILLDSLKVQSGYNILGLRGNSITSTFALGSLNNPVAQDKAQKLIKAFNDLDIEEDTKNMVTNRGKDPMKWRDLFYVYNLLVNNERYGDKSLTPLFEDYVKEKSSLGYDYVMYSSKIDSGELDLFDVDRQLSFDPEYELAAKNHDLREMQKLREKAEIEIANDILFYTFHDGGQLSIKSGGEKDTNLKVSNGDFVVVTSLTETPEVKKGWADFAEVVRLLKGRGYIIKFEC